MSISYPFAAVPNQVARGGHGAINLAVLVVILSHGECTASAKTIAKEVGCCEKMVKKAIKYWIENGKAAGIEFIHKTRKEGKVNKTNVSRVVIHRMEDTYPQVGAKMQGGGCKNDPTLGAKMTPGVGAKMTPKEEPLEEEQLRISAGNNFSFFGHDENEMTPIRHLLRR